MAAAWGNPKVPYYKKKFIRTVKAGGYSVFIHAALVNQTAEILQAVISSGIHLTSEPVGWIPYVAGESPLEEGRSLYLPGDFPKDAFTAWGFTASGGQVWTFHGTTADAKALAEQADVDRSLRCMPRLTRSDGTAVTVFPGDREAREGDFGPDIEVFQLVYDCATRNGECDRLTIDTAGYIQKRNGVPMTGSIDEYAWMVTLPTTLNMYQDYGCSGQVVRVLQALLLCYDWDSGDVIVNGRFDQATMAAVSVLQDTYGLRASGAVGPAEWAILLGREVRRV
jgi:peptidoglycan hydrolase-like protein with peptidoglycan-binding domain